MVISPVAIMMGTFGFLIVLGIPIAFAIGLASLLILNVEPRLDPWLLTQRTFAGLDSFVLIAIPMFLLNGNIMNSAKITERLIDMSEVLVGWIRGGLGHVNVVTSMVFAGISGSSVADTASEGSIIIPAMVKRGYRLDYTVAVTVCSSTLGQIIPPSIMMIIYGATVGASIGGLFLAGVVPGLLIGFSQMGLTYFYAVKHNYPREPMPSFGKAVRSVLAGLPPMGAFVIIVGGITYGVFTATEASVIAVCYSTFLAMVVYRSLSIREFWRVLGETAVLSSLTLLCIGLSGVLGYLIGFYHMPELVASLFAGIASSPQVIMLLILVIFTIVGTFMDATPAIVVLMPILAPIAHGAGIHPVHLGVVVVLTMALGLVTPPYGLCLLLGCSIAGTTLDKVMGPVLVFTAVMWVIILVCAMSPDLVLFLPRLVAPNLVN